MRKTPLFDIHKSLGAKLVDFSGWEMPLQYQGIISEHNAVRKAAGLFDVSHMGVISVEGLDATSILETLSTNEIVNKADGTATYTVWCHEQGGAVDDLIIYKKKTESLFVVANASNREKDFNHLQSFSTGKNVKISKRYNNEGILALQGPQSLKILSQIFTSIPSLEHMHIFTTSFLNTPIDISRTGYTGELGYELFASNEVLVPLWHALMDAGKDLGIQPVGLGARDTLRLEMGYALYGHELDESICPSESVSAWTVKISHPFIGRNAIQELELSQKKRHQYGVILQDSGIARQGYSVFLHDKRIGSVTSGTFSPTLQKAIAIVFVDTKLRPDDIVAIEIRGKLCNAKVIKLPFHKPNTQ